MEVKTKIDSNGRIVIPASIREALGIHRGDELVLRVKEGEVRLFSLQCSIEQAQRLVQKHNKAKQNLSDELIKMRRKEAKDE